MMMRYFPVGGGSVARVTVWMAHSATRYAIVVVVALYGLIGFFVVPVIAKKLIVDIARERTGREVTVGEVTCNPFTMSLTVLDFSMPDRQGSVLLSFDELHANAQISSLFRWAATLKELRVENPYIGFRRFADGDINVLELMDDIEQRTPPDDDPDDEGGLPRAVLHHILVNGSTIDVEDFAREEPLEMTIGPSRYEFHDISTIPEKRGENDFEIGLMKGGTIGVTGDVVVEPLGLNGTVTLDQLLLENAWPLLKPYFKFDLMGGSAGGRFAYAVALHDDGLQVSISDLDYRVEDLELKLRDSDTNLLKVPLITVADARGVWPAAEVGAASVVVEGAAAFIWLESDGTPSWADLVPEETQVQVVETYREVEEAFPWVVDVQRFEIKGASARFEDRTFDEPVRLAVENAGVVLTDILTGPGHQWGLAAAVTLFGEANATADGFVTTGPMRLETEVDVNDLDVGHFQPYIERIAPLELRAGILESKGTATVDPKGDGPALSFAGDLTIHEIDLRETAVGSRVLQWGRVESRGIGAELGPQSVEIASIDIHGAGIEVVVSEDGRVNLIELFKVMAERSAEVGGGAATEVPPITVDAVTLHGCSSAYTDRTLTPPFTLALDPVDGTVTGISSTATAGSAIEIDGPVRSGGMVHIDGEMDLFNPKRLTDLSIDVRQAVLPPMAPMSVRYIGHPIDEGTVDITLKYEIITSDLVGSNRFVTDGLALGDKVEGEGMVDLPFKLGVSLLTDKDGRITLEFPIEGDLEDPGFGIGNAIGSAVKEITAELVKSPFRLLGKLGGGSGDEDFGFVEFAAGSDELDSNAVQKLRTLAAGVDQRPEVGLLVEGAVDPNADTFALKEASLDAVTAEKQGADAGPASLELLESLYLDAASREALDELRARHEGEGGFDETSYYRDLWVAVIEAQPVDSAVIEALAGARAEAIRAFLVDQQKVAPSQVRIIEPVTLEQSTDGKWVRCRLDIATAE